MYQLPERNTRFIKQCDPLDLGNGDNLAGLTYEEGKGFFEQGLERKVPGVKVPAQAAAEVRRRLRTAYLTLYEIIPDD